MKPLILSTILILLLISCKKSETTHIVNPPVSWHLVFSQAKTPLSDLFFATKTTGFAVGSVISDDGTYLHGIILKTTNGGTSWEDNSPANLPDLSAIYFTDSLTGYAAGTSTILKTTDGGNNWLTVLKDYTLHPQALCFPSKDTGFAVCLSGKILRTINAGQSWEFQESATKSELLSVCFTDKNTGFIAGYFNQTGSEHGIILKTTNAGASWDSIPYVGETMPNYVVFPTPETGYISGGNSMLKTTDGGNTWSISYPVPNCNLGAISFIPGSPYGFLSTSCGKMFKTIDGASTWSEVTTPSSAFMSVIRWPEYNTAYAAGYDFDAKIGTILKWY